MGEEINGKINSWNACYHSYPILSSFLCCLKAGETWVRGQRRMS